jgi:hypothetical protein
MTTIPDFQTLVCDRLYTIYGKIAGIQRREKYPPSFTIGLNDVPMLYTIVGNVLDPYPNRRAGSFTIRRTYVVRLVGEPLGQSQDTARGAGARGYAALVPFIAVVYGYFLNHPLLEVGEVGDADYEGPLQYMMQDVLITDTGVIDEQAPGGLSNYTVDFPLIIEMRSNLTGIR